MATDDGLATLPAVLDAYCRLDAPDRPWQLLIVDHGGTDDIAALVARHTDRLPLRRLHAPRRGEHVALNPALETVLGEHAGADDLLIFTDAAARPGRDWLRRWEACAREHPDYAVFGGAVVPDWASAYILRKAWRCGCGKYRQDRAGMYPELLGVPRWMLRRYVLECARLLHAAARRDRDGVFRRRRELAFLQGYFHEARLGRRNAQSGRKNILVTSYSGELGGMELRMAQEVRYLRAAGYDSGLAMRRFAGVADWARRLAGERISLAEYEPPLFFEQWEWRRLNLWRARLLAGRRLRAFRADLVHVALCWTNYGASVLWLARRCRLPAVISVHNAFQPASFNDWHQPLLKQAFGGVRGIYAVSESAMAHFMALYRPYIAPSTRLAVIPNSVDTRRFRPSAALRLAARRRLRVPDDALVIGSIGRLSERKQPGTALAMLGMLRKAFPDLYLVLAGTGPLEADVRKQAERMGLAPYVIFTGFVPAVEELLPALDVHLLLSRNEGFGISTIEAMACGVPAVATDVPGSADILRGSEGGILIPEGDLKNAAPMVAALLIDPERRADMGRKGRAEVEQRYSEEIVGKQVRAFYDGLV
ncbi:MAG: glycosyltransferase [Duganella sp.]